MLDLEQLQREWSVVGALVTVLDVHRHGSPNANAVDYVWTRVPELLKELARLQRINEIEKRSYDRLNLCSDHRDKANGRCIVCVAEERAAELVRNKDERE